MDYHIATSTMILLAVLVIWELVWKGFALWRAARRDQLVWFIPLLVINSAGLLPIVYLIYTSLHPEPPPTVDRRTAAMRAGSLP